MRVTYSTFTIAEYLLFAVCFYSLIHNRKFKSGILFFSVCFTLFAILYSIFVKYRVLDSIPIGIETILILIYTFYFLYEQMGSVSQTLIYNKFSFWIVVGILIYLAGSFFIYIFAAQVDQETRGHYWIFSNIFTIIKYIFFSLAMFIKHKELALKKTKRTLFI